MSQDHPLPGDGEHGSSEDLQRRDVPFRITLVMQGGGALGSYHGGVYQALHESGLEPDRIIGTSIGAISGAIIAGNTPDRRLERLNAFWEGIVPQAPAVLDLLPSSLRRQAAQHMALTMGVPGLFSPNMALALGWRVPVGLEHSALFSAAPLAQTLTGLIDFKELNSGTPRFSFGLVNITDGSLHYHDTRDGPIELEHILASAALPPSFPPVRIDGVAYWDAGFYDNNPLEAAFEDAPGSNSIIFASNLWSRVGPEPRSLSEAWRRQKGITFASRAGDQVARHVQSHRLRHVIRHLIDMLPDDKREALRERNFADYASESLIHLVQLNAPGPAREDPFDDIDFSSLALRERWAAGYDDARRMIDRRPWDEPINVVDGVAVHNPDD